MPGTQRERLGDVVCRAGILQPEPSLGTLGPVPHSVMVAAALPCPQRGLGAPWDTLVPCRGVEVQRPVEPRNSLSSLLSGMQFFPRQEKQVRTLIPGPALSWEWVGVPGRHLQTQHGDSDFFSRVSPGFGPCLSLPFGRKGASTGVCALGCPAAPHPCIPASLLQGDSPPPEPSAPSSSIHPERIKAGSEKPNKQTRGENPNKPSAANGAEKLPCKSLPGSHGTCQHPLALPGAPWGFRVWR